MTKKNAPLMALMISLIVLAQCIGGISCLVKKFGPDSLGATEQDAINARIKWLEEQKFEEPDTPAPLEINVDNVVSHTTRIGGEGMGGVGGIGGGGDGGGGGGGDGGGGGG